ncbi:Mdm33 family-domain-containing protein [Phakopsora pachyrhizi]|uniref:Sensitive to high expression protein 9, mitochondrial n=1 Tax=Phakopsora pachyrhizi TaxID=170000 RepID=A0AAV0BRM2_PHAPC|nr:Mdm33 family-domain-containing protein [Phakopsora pachyrhizi]CAH7688233.1 Mdm33 family-domain-containing protein [Phakopsora pachyrhizi]
MELFKQMNRVGLRVANNENASRRRVLALGISSDYIRERSHYRPSTDNTRYHSNQPVDQTDGSNINSSRNLELLDKTELRDENPNTGKAIQSKIKNDSNIYKNFEKIRERVLMNSKISDLLTNSKSYRKLLKKRLRIESEDFKKRLSDLSGYKEIDELKDLVQRKQDDLNLSRNHCNEMKVEFDVASKRRAESVREVNDLLARKASWTDDDLMRFTTLVKTDHTNEQLESRAKQALELAETKVDAEFTALMQAILSRYHEEQIWSDKIRSLSTTASLTITIVNVLIFLISLVLIEPFKREKVIKGVEERMIIRDEDNKAEMDMILNETSDRLLLLETYLKTLVDLISIKNSEQEDLKNQAEKHLLNDGDGINNDNGEKEKELKDIFTSNSQASNTCINKELESLDDKKTIEKLSRTNEIDEFKEQASKKDSNNDKLIDDDDDIDIDCNNDKEREKENKQERKYWKEWKELNKADSNGWVDDSKENERIKTLGIGLATISLILIGIFHFSSKN